MHKTTSLVLGALLLPLFVACAPTANVTTSDIYQKPEEIYTFSVPADSISREVQETKPRILKGFPFLSNQPVVDFKGKFPPEFYSQFKCTPRAEYLKNADLWRLRNDQNYYDVIYCTPLWIGEMVYQEKDFLRSIAYSYNISDEQVSVLENWVKQGGTLWIESAIYISVYDYNLNRLNDAKVEELLRNIRKMSLFGNELEAHMIKTRKIDEFNTERLFREITPEDTPQLQEIDKNRKVRKLLLEQSDYIGIYVTLKANPAIKASGRTYLSYVNYGKGRIITVSPLDFKNARYDGEMMRLSLLSWMK